MSRHEVLLIFCIHNVVDNSKFITMSERGVATILYDGECSLCINASNFAESFLTKRKIPINKVKLQSLETEQDFKFTFFHEGGVFYDQYAWIKIISLGGKFYKYFEFITKSKMIMKIVIGLYNFISKIRKFFNKKGCGC